jgi:hypothetical protein
LPEEITKPERKRPRWWIPVQSPWTRNQNAFPPPSRKLATGKLVGDVLLRFMRDERTVEWRLCEDVLANVSEPRVHVVAPR